MRNATNDLPNGTPVAHIDPAIQGTGKTLWLCIRNSYRVRWADGTYTTTPREKLVVLSSTLTVEG